MFVQTSSCKKRKDHVAYYFYCHRSYLGKKHVKKTAHKEKNAGSKKMSKSCPAMMKAVSTNGAVKVEYCSTHLGRECSMGRLRLSIDDRNLLAGKLSAGVPPRHILTDIRQNAKSVDDRIKLTEMSDLYKHTESSFIYDQNDRISVESWIKEKQKLPEADNPVIFYKDQNSNYENFETSDMILILMTKFQKEMLLKFGQNVVCIDGTHGLNDYNFQLFTILVHDEYGEGIPVVFCFSNKSTKELYKLFFTEVKKTIDKSIAPNVFMSDGEMSFNAAWIDVMLPATHQLICRWHLNKIWVTNLNKITKPEKRNLVLQTLNTLMMEEDRVVFTASLKNFLSRLQLDNDTINFYHYLKKNFEDNVQIWAQCYRMNVPIHTNMGLEALHKNIKYNYLNGTRCIRLDKTIYALMRLIQDKEFERVIKFVKQKPSKKLPLIKQSHEISIECDSNVEKLSEDKWSVRSSTNSTQHYQVSRIKYEPCCVHICKKCRICLHMVQCSCYDYSVKQNICKHIHAVMRSQLKENNANDVSQEEFQDIVYHPIVEENNSSMRLEFDQLQSNDESDREKQEKDRLLARWSAILGALENATLSSKQRSKILKYFDAISATSSSVSKEKTQPRINSRKKIVKQTFFSTKKCKEKKVFIPPSSQNSAFVMQGLINNETEEVSILTKNLGEHLYSFTQKKP